MHYIQRERDKAGPDGSHYEYAVGARIEDGDVVVDRWVTQERAIKLGASYEDAAARMLADCLGCLTTLFEAPPAPVVAAPKVDPAEERRRRVARYLPRDERIARGFGTDKDHAEAEQERRHAAEQAARAAEAKRRASVDAAIAAGKVDEARALMSEEEQARFDRQQERAAAAKERERVQQIRAALKAGDDEAARALMTADERVALDAAQAKRAERETQTIAAADVGEVPAELLRSER